MRTAITTFLCIAALAACGGADDGAARDTTTPTISAGSDTGVAGGSAGARAQVRNASGRELGTLTLTDSAQSIVVSGGLAGLPPGTHAIHLHTTGQCEAPFESAGGHWNPTNRQHGAQNPQGPHQGDLPNITVAGDSSVTVRVATPGGMLRGSSGLLDADGAAVVVHAGPDDNRTDPSGNSGDRIACGVVTG